MFGIGGSEFVIIAFVALFIFGPDRLPGAVKTAARMLHDVRRWTTKARADLTDTLGPEFENFDLADLNPKRFVQKHLLEGLDDVDEEEAERRRAERRAAAAATPSVEPVGATALGASVAEADHGDVLTAPTTDAELDGAATRVDTLALTESAPDEDSPSTGDPVSVATTRPAGSHIDYDAT